MIKDIIVIGLGPAGIAASIYAKRSGLDVLALESKMPGGLMNYTNIVNNYPGFVNITGPDLSFKMLEHFNSLKIDYKNEDVIDIIDGEVKTVVTNKESYKCKYVIIATGRTRRSLNLDGEKELIGHGISYCAMCDGHFYKDKDVVVVGAGDSSIEEAIYLAKLARNVTIVVRGKRLAATKALVDELNILPNINVEFGRNIVQLNQDNGKLKSVTLDDDRTIDTEGLFIYIGFEPILPFRTDLGFEKENGYLVVDKDFETNIEGIYAVGDIIKKDLYQIITASSEGASAASAIARKLTRKE